MATKAAEQDYVQDLGEIFLKRNDTFERKITGLTDANGIAWDFDGVFTSCRGNTGEQTPTFSFSTDDTTLDMSTPGELFLSLAKIATDKEPGRYPIDFEFRTAVNKDYTLYKGVIVVYDDITK